MCMDNYTIVVFRSKLPVQINQETELLISAAVVTENNYYSTLIDEKVHQAKIFENQRNCDARYCCGIEY